MVSVPNSQQFNAWVRPPQECIVNLGPEGGGLGDTEQSNTQHLICTSIQRSEGGEMLLDFEYSLGLDNDRLQDFQFAEGHGRLVEVYLPSQTADPGTLLGWGECLLQAPRVGTDEVLQITAKVSRAHFGTSIVGPLVFDSEQVSEADQHHTPIVFNPEIDGKIMPNMTAHDLKDDALNEIELRLWIDPESVRTSKAIQYAQGGETATLWTLPEAVLALCYLANRNEEFIQNPRREELTAVFVLPNGDPEPPLRNFTLATGDTLNEALSALLKPHGYSWYLAVTYDSDPFSERYGLPVIQIKVFRLGTGIVKSVYQPAVGTTLSATGQQNTLEWTLEQGLDELRNQVAAFGGLMEREITVELQRGWPTSKDALEIEDLQKESPKWLENQYVWRMWVGNEAGDYVNTRAEITDPLDLWIVLGDSSRPKRRPLKPCITRVRDPLEDDHRLNPVIERIVYPEDGKEILTIATQGAPSSATWWIEWGADDVGPFDLSTTAADVATALDGVGVTIETSAGGPLGTAPIVLTCAAGSPHRVHVYITAISGGDNPGVYFTSNYWQRIPDGWGPVLLDNQIGVYFNGDKAVEDLLGLYDTDHPARLRITGTIQGDTRLSYTAEKKADSPYGRVNELVLDLSDRFPDRKVHLFGKFGSVLAGSGPTDTQSDATGIQEFAERVLEVEDAANVQARIVLAGLRTDFQIGDLIDKIGGREISLNRKSVTSTTKKYCQVMGIQFKPMDQQTILTVEPLDQTGQMLLQLERRIKRRKGH